MGFLKDAVLKVLSIGGKVLMLMTAGIVAERIADKFLPQKEAEPEEEDQEENEGEKESSVWSYNQQQQ